MAAGGLPQAPPRGSDLPVATDQQRRLQQVILAQHAAYADDGWFALTACRDDASRAADGLPSAADVPLQSSELAKSAIS